MVDIGFSGVETSAKLWLRKMNLSGSGKRPMAGSYVNITALSAFIKVGNLYPS
jgi:hypothetical protein